jgi:hypothetical protein
MAGCRFATLARNGEGVVSSRQMNSQFCSQINQIRKTPPSKKFPIDCDGTGCISYYGQFYRVPDHYIGRRVWTSLKGDTLTIDSGKEVIASYQIRTDYLKAIPQES